MSAQYDVFLSYASEDRGTAQRLAAGLGQSGLSVWWDRRIPVGSEWDKAIEESLAAAQCVVVLWTAHTKRSRWVRAEARDALNKEKLIPVMLEDNAIPLAFTGIQALKFLAWEGNADSKEFEILHGIILAKIAGKPFAFPEASSTQASWLGKMVAGIGVKTRIGAVLALLLLVSSFLPVSPEVAIHVQTARIQFSVVTKGEDRRLTDTLAFDALTVQNIGRISFSPDRLLVADPRDYDLVSDTYPLKAWVDLPVNGQRIQLMPDTSGAFPEVTFESPEGKGRVAGVLDGIILTQDTVVTLEVTEDNSIIWVLRTQEGQQRAVLSNVQAIALIETGLRLSDDIAVPIPKKQGLTYQALYENQPGTMEVIGQGRELVMILRESHFTPKPVFSRSVLPVRSVDFSWQDPGTGERKIPQEFEGTVEYLNPRGMPPVNIQHHSFLTLDDLDHFEITAIKVNPASHTFAVEMQGEAGYLKTGTFQNPHDLRPTVYDVIRLSPLFEPVKTFIGF